MAYVYRHIRLDKNVPFYIGISKKDDADYSRAHEFGRRYRSERWCNVFNKTGIEVDILMEGIPHSLAKEKEKEFIAIYKRKEDGGTLVNLTLGGDGKPGCKNPSLSKRNKNGLWLGKTHTEDSKRRISFSNMGKKHTPEAKLKMSIAGKGRIGCKNSNYRGAVYAYRNGVLVHVFGSIAEASTKLDTDPGVISSIISGKKPSNKGWIYQRTPELFINRVAVASPNRIYKNKLINDNKNQDKNRDFKPP